MHPTPFHRLLGELHQHSYFPIFFLVLLTERLCGTLVPNGIPLGDAQRPPRRDPTTLSLLSSLSLTREREELIASFYEVNEHYRAKCTPIRNGRNL